MATCQKIIEVAWRRSGVFAAGVDIPDTQMTVGLERLQDMYNNMVGEGLLGRFNDVWLDAGATYVAQEQDRIYCTDNTVVVTVNTTFVDANTGKTRTPLDRAAIIIVKPFNDDPTSLQIWDAYSGAWVNVEALAIGDYAPFSKRFEEGLKNFLAVKLADEAGYSIRPSLARDAGMFKMQISRHLDDPRRTVKIGSYF